MKNETLSLPFETDELANDLRAREFDRLHPIVWERFVKFAREAIAAGFWKFSARAIIERVRWSIQMETVERDFKINNNHVPYYARKFLRRADCPPGFFELRR